jgi:hypothetical protein
MMTRVLSLALAAGAAACAPSPRQRPILLSDVPTGAGSLIEARKYLEGRWTLQWYEVFPPGQPPIRLTGKGTLIYDEYGNLEVQIRADEASLPLLTQAGVQTTNGVFETKGRAAVDMQSRTLTYIVEGKPPIGIPSDPLAINRTRHGEVSGNVLTLTTQDDDGRPAAVGRWVKEP